MPAQMGGEYYQLAKFYGHAQDGFYPNYPTYQTDASAAAAYTNVLASQYKPKSERGFFPPPELYTSSRSRRVLVASLVASADSPATLAPGEPNERSKNGNLLCIPEIPTDDDHFLQDKDCWDAACSCHFFPDPADSLSLIFSLDPIGLSSVVPKCERTMTNIFADELFNPSFSIDTSSPSQIESSHQAASPSNKIFAQRFQAANSQHMSPVAGVSRDRSPFRNGSPLAPSPLHDLGSAQPPQQHRHQHHHQHQQVHPIGLNTTQQMRERRKAEQDAQAMRQQLQGSSHVPTPETISPKDVSLEFPNDGEAHNVPLFPQRPSTVGGGFATNEQINKAVAKVGGGMPLDFYWGIQIPQHYPFVPGRQLSVHERNSATPIRTDPTSAASPAPSGTTSNGSHSNISPAITSPQRPAPGAMRADGGTYSCTYHGCPERFDTPALLQKHKREGHRQRRNGEADLDAQGNVAGMTSSLLDTQSGPHHCQRINPSTCKPCSAIFSRPYDLTRHEGTIHNARKQKVRCHVCTEEKTFSRVDALTRHFRVVHPDLEAPGHQPDCRAIHIQAAIATADECPPT